MTSGWISRPIHDFAQRIRDINRQGLELEPLSVTKGEGVVLQSSRFKKRVATDLRKYQVASRGDFVFDPMSMYYGSIGRLDVADTGVVSPDYVVFGIDDTVDSDFLLSLLRWPRMTSRFERLSERGNRTGKRRRLYWAVFKDMEVQLPPLAEQRKIAAILASVDEAIEKTQAVIDQVQVVKKGLMQELLTRGLPGRHARFKRTLLGEVPAAWELKKVGEVCRTTSGGTPSRSQPAYWGGNIPWVKTGEIDYCTIAATQEHITSAGMESSSAKLLPSGTLLMAMYGQGVTRGKVAILGIEAATNQACLALLATQSVDSRFLYHYFTATYDRLRSLGGETSQKNLSSRVVNSILVPVPSLSEQHEIIETLEQIDSRRLAESACLEGLRNLKSGLTSVLLTGEIRVRVEGEQAA